MAGFDAQTGSLFWRLVWRALLLRRQRVLIVFLALLVGAAIVSAMASVYFDIDAKMSRELRTFGANFFLGPVPDGERNTIDQAVYRRVLDEAPADLVTGSSPFLYGIVRLEQEQAVLVGVNFSGIRQVAPYWQVEGHWIGVDFDDRHAMIGRNLATKLELKQGDSIAVLEEGQSYRLAIKGIVETGEATDNYLIVNLELAQRLLRHPGEISNVLFSLVNDGNRVERFAAELQQQMPQLTVRPIRRVSASEGKVLNKIKELMALVSVIILGLTTLCVNITLTAMIGERRQELALQKALGADAWDITRQLLTETVLIAAAALALGMMLGFVLAQLLGHTVFAASIDMRWQVVPTTSILCLMTAAVATILPMRQATAIRPAIVLKGE